MKKTRSALGKDILDKILENAEISKQENAYMSRYRHGSCFY